MLAGARGNEGIPGGLGTAGRIISIAAASLLIVLVQLDWYEIGLLAPAPGNSGPRYRGARFYWMAVCIALQRPLFAACFATLLYAQQMSGAGRYMSGFAWADLISW